MPCFKGLGKAKVANRNRIAAGKKPKLAGKAVSLSTFNRKTGAKLSKARAKRIKKQARKR